MYLCILLLVVWVNACIGTNSPTVSPTVSPSGSPSVSPSVSPSSSPSASPTTAGPSASPSVVPTGAPSISPTMSPTLTVQFQQLSSRTSDSDFGHQLLLNDDMIVLNDGGYFDTYKLSYSTIHGVYNYEGSLSTGGMIPMALSGFGQLFVTSLDQQSVSVYEMSGGVWVEQQRIDDERKFTSISNKTLFGSWIKVAPSNKHMVITSIDGDFSDDDYYSSNKPYGLGYNVFYEYLNGVWSSARSTGTSFGQDTVTEFGFKGGWASEHMLFLHMFVNSTIEKLYFYNSSRSSWNWLNSVTLSDAYVTDNSDFCGVSGGVKPTIVASTTGVVQIIDVDLNTYAITIRQNISDPGTSGGSSFGSNTACMSKGFVTGNYHYTMNHLTGVFSLSEVLTPDPGSGVVVAFGSNTHSYGFVNNATRVVNVFQNTPKPTMSPTGSPSRSPTTRSPTPAPVTPVASTSVPTGSPTSLGNSPGETTSTPTVAPEPSVFEEPLMIASLGILGMLVLSLTTLFFLRDTSVAPASYFSLA